MIKVIWGDDWDELLEDDETGLLIKRMGEVVDGQYQKYTAMPGSYVREHFFGKYPELLKLVKNYSDEKLEQLRRGGHDPEKVYAAYHLATTLRNGRPTVILAKTIKGYGLGEVGRRQEHRPQQEKGQRRGIARVSQSLWNPDQRRRRRQGPLLQTAGRQPGNAIPPGATSGVGWIRTQPTAQLSQL